MDEETTGWVAIIGWSIATAASSANPRTYAVIIAATAIATLALVGTWHAWLTDTSTHLALSETIRLLGYTFGIGAIIGTAAIGAFRQRMMDQPGGYLPFLARLCIGAAALIAALLVASALAPPDAQQLPRHETFWIVASTLATGTTCWSIAFLREQRHKRKEPYAS